MTISGFGFYWLTVKNLFIFKPNPVAVFTQMPTRVWLIVALGCVAADTFHEWQYPSRSIASHILHHLRTTTPSMPAPPSCKVNSISSSELWPSGSCEYLELTASDCFGVIIKGLIRLPTFHLRTAATLPAGVYRALRRLADM